MNVHHWVSRVTATLSFAATASAQERLWTSAASGEELGSSFDRVDDLDGDGVPDLVAGASATASLEGSVYAISGATGATIWRVFGLAANDELGCAVAGLPDVNGDGVADFVAGARQSPMGLGYVIVGSGVDGTTLYSLAGPEAGSYFGAAVARLDDQDGDGIDDFAVGASQADNGSVVDAGRVTVHSATSGKVLFTLQSPKAAEYLGTSVADAGDADRDGIGDLIVGAPQPNKNGYAVVVSVVKGSLLLRIDGLKTGDRLGACVNGAGDVDGDGVADLVVGAPGWDRGTGKGMARIVSGKDGHIFADVTGSADGDAVGSCVAGAGDIDGDGFPEICVGAPNVARNGIHTGLLRLWSSRVGATLYTFEGATDLGVFGRCAVRLGDVDADGHDELVIGDGSSLHAFRGNDLYLTGDPGTYLAGETVELRTQFGAPWQPTALFILDFGGTPHLLNIDLGVLDASGMRRFQETVPAGLAGIDVTLQAFALSGSNRVVDTGIETVALR